MKKLLLLSLGFVLSLGINADSQLPFKEQEIDQASIDLELQEQQMQFLNALTSATVIEVIKSNKNEFNSLKNLNKNSNNDDKKREEYIQKIVSSVETCAKKVIPQVLEEMFASLEKSAAPSRAEKDNLIKEVFSLVVTLATKQVIEYIAIDAAVFAIINEDRIQLRN